MMPKYTRGWIRMQVLAGLVDIGQFVSGIANNDTEMSREQVFLLMSHLSGQLGKTIEWKRSQPRHGIKVSTVVGYLEVVLNSNGVPPPESEQSS